MADTVTCEICQSSGRFDRPIGAVEKSVDFLESIAKLVFHTEVSSRTLQQIIFAFKNPGWKYGHVAGAGADECLTEWEVKTWDLAEHPTAHQITEKTWVRADAYGGKKAAYVSTLVVVLRHKKTGKVVVTFITHMPLDNTKARAEIWVDCCKGIVALKRKFARMYPGCEFLIAADWNKNWKAPKEREMLVKHLAKPLKMTYVWSHVEHLPDGGTEGKSIIDGFFVSDGIRVLECGLAPDDPSSDHRPMKAKVGIPKALQTKEA